jgi:hypothetical protein
MKQSLSGHSALEVVTKMCDLGFARKAQTVDFYHRAWMELRRAGAGDGDKANRSAQTQQTYC